MDKKRCTINNMPIDTWDELKVLSIRLGIPVAKVVARAIELLKKEVADG